MGGPWPGSLSPNPGTHSPGVEGKLPTPFSPAMESTSNDSSVSGKKPCPFAQTGWSSGVIPCGISRAICCDCISDPLSSLCLTLLLPPLTGVSGARSRKLPRRSSLSQSVSSGTRSKTPRMCCLLVFRVETIWQNHSKPATPSSEWWLPQFLLKQHVSLISPWRSLGHTILPGTDWWGKCLAPAWRVPTARESENGFTGLVPGYEPKATGTKPSAKTRQRHHRMNRENLCRQFVCGSPKG